MNKKVFYGVGLTLAIGVGGKVAWDETYESIRESEQKEREAHVEAHAALRGFSSPEVQELSQDDEGIIDAELRFNPDLTGQLGSFCFISYAKNSNDFSVAEEIDFSNCD